MSNLNVADKYNKMCDGEVELIIKDAKTKKVLNSQRFPNIIKIFAKEIMSHRIAHSKVWDPNGGTAGQWVDSEIDPNEEFSIKYILLGAAFDDDGSALDSTDTRFYTYDPVSGNDIPITLEPSAEFEGGLINGIPIAEPNRPLKRIERIYFEPSYQPSSVPLLQSDVRAINNVVVFETTLRSDEYNGFDQSVGDFFNITEVALAAGKEITDTVECECIPRDLFLDGRTDGTAIRVTANGSSTVSIIPDDAIYATTIKEGDQIKLVDSGDTASDNVSIDAVSDYYLVVSKSTGGSDITLDRNVVDVDGNAITGTIGLFRSTLRIYSHRILSTPFKKSESYEITIRWRISMA